MAKEGTRRTEEVILGKKFASESFPTIKSAAMVDADDALQAKFKHENAVTIEQYMMIRGHSEPTLQAMMRAHTKVRSATLDAFDDLFHSFFNTAPKKPAVTKEG